MRESQFGVPSYDAGPGPEHRAGFARAPDYVTLELVARTMSHVLIITPNSSPRAALVELLRAEGYSALAVHDSGAALLAQREVRADVVLIDLSARDGASSIASITELRHAAAETHIIAMTDAPEHELSTDGQMRDTHASILAAGANTVVAKPIQFDELLAVLSRFRAKRRQSGTRPCEQARALETERHDGRARRKA